MWYEGTFCAKVAVSHRVHVEVHTFVDVFVEGCIVVPILGIEAGFGALRLVLVELGTRSSTSSREAVSVLYRPNIIVLTSGGETNGWNGIREHM